GGVGLSPGRQLAEQPGIYLDPILAGDGDRGAGWPADHHLAAAALRLLRPRRGALQWGAATVQVVSQARSTRHPPGAALAAGGDDDDRPARAEDGAGDRAGHHTLPLQRP